MARKINERLKITVIGCGACGNSITAEIENKIRELGGDKANTTFIGINTSTEELASVNLSHKIHINNSKGAACNRESSIQDLAESIDTILEELKSYIIEDSIVFIATSLGGGTGSAIAPMLAEIAVTEFTGCYALEELTLAADCNYNGNTFSNCQLLYPKPQ